MCSKNNLSVILANDVPFLTGLMRLAIADIGYDVVAEASLKSEIIEGCKEHYPNLVIIDMQLPEREMIRLIENILDIDVTIAIVIISELIEGLSEKVLSSGARAYLQKPYTTHDLIDIVRKVAPVIR